MCYKVEIIENIDDFGVVVAPEVVIEYAEDLHEPMIEEEDEIPEAIFEYFYNLPWGPQSNLDYDFEMSLSQVDEVNAFLDSYLSDEF